MQEILEGVAAKLKELYPGAEIYQNNIPQNLELPCFLLQQSIATSKPRISNQQLRRFPLVITYLPEDERDNKSRLEVSDCLLQEFLVVDIPNGQVRGFNPQSELAAGELHVTIDYVYHLEPVGSKDKMEVLEEMKEEVRN